MTGVSDKPYDGLTARFAGPLRALIRRISTAEQIERLANPAWFKGPPLAWGEDRIGIGLLKALRARRSIVFADGPSPGESVPSKSGHLVVCEQGDDLAEVIAANYAYALRAGLCLVPEIGRALSDELGKFSKAGGLGRPMMLSPAISSSSRRGARSEHQLLNWSWRTRGTTNSFDRSISAPSSASGSRPIFPFSWPNWPSLGSIAAMLLGGHAACILADCVEKPTDNTRWRRRLFRRRPRSRRGL
jgi:hypothetical protein